MEAVIVRRAPGTSWRHFRLCCPPDSVKKRHTVWGRVWRDDTLYGVVCWGTTHCMWSRVEGRHTVWGCVLRDETLYGVACWVTTHCMGSRVEGRHTVCCRVTTRCMGSCVEGRHTVCGQVLRDDTLYGVAWLGTTHCRGSRVDWRAWNSCWQETRTNGHVSQEATDSSALRLKELNL